MDASNDHDNAPPVLTSPEVNAVPTDAPFVTALPVPSLDAPGKTEASAPAALLDEEESTEERTATLPNAEEALEDAPSSSNALASAASETTPPLKAACQILQVPLASVAADPDQPRRHFDESRLKELAADIKRHGIDQPLIVQSNGEGGYRLVAGERRLRAAQLAKLGAIPVLVRDDLSPHGAALLQLRENLQREDLSPVETAEGLERYRGLTGKTWTAIAKEFGWRTTSLHAKRKVLQAPEPLRELLAEKKLGASHYGEIAALSPEQQVVIAERIVAEGLTVEEIRPLAREARAEEARKPAKAELRSAEKADDHGVETPSGGEGTGEDDSAATTDETVTFQEASAPRRRGRPKAATRELRVLLDAAVFDGLEARAKAAGKSITSFARQLLTDAADVPNAKGPQPQAAPRREVEPHLKVDHSAAERLIAAKAPRLEDSMRRSA